VADWPIYEYLKQHFANQRGYRQRVKKEKAKLAAQNKGKGRAVDEQRDSDFGSAASAGNEKSDEEGSQ
jgi:hypothetical protein